MRIICRIKHRNTWRTCTLALMLGVVSGTLHGCGAGDKTSPAARGAPLEQYAFWPNAPAHPRIQFVRSYTSSNDVTASTPSALDRFVFGPESVKTAEVNKPYGVAMRDGKVYVCDMRAGSLVIFDLRKKQTRLVGSSGLNRLTHPVAVAVADDGYIYVADNERGGIVVFDPTERYSQVFGHEKFKPVSLALHGDTLYACDMASQCVVVFDRKSGKLLRSIGSVGDEDGQFRLPVGVATDSAGNIYVADMMRCRVQKFTPEGKFLVGVGQMGDYAGAFSRPKHLSVDKDGILYVVDSAFQNVQMFDSEMRILMSFGAAGDFPGAMNLPVGICVSEDSVEFVRDQIHPGFDPKRLIVVTSQFGDSKVSVYAMGTIGAGYTIAELSKASIRLPTGTGASAERLLLQEQGTEASGEGATEGSAPAPGSQVPLAPAAPASPR